MNTFSKSGVLAFRAIGAQPLLALVPQEFNTKDIKDLQ